MNRIFKIFLLVGLVTLPAALFVADSQHLLRTGSNEPEQAKMPMEDQEYSSHAALQVKSYK